MAQVSQIVYYTPAFFGGAIIKATQTCLVIPVSDRILHRIHGPLSSMEFIPFSTDERAVTSVDLFLPITVKVLPCVKAESWCGNIAAPGCRMVTRWLQHLTSPPSVTSASMMKLRTNMYCKAEAASTYDYDDVRYQYRGLAHKHDTNCPKEVNRSPRRGAAPEVECPTCCGSVTVFPTF